MAEIDEYETWTSPDGNQIIKVPVKGPYYDYLQKRFAVVCMMFDGKRSDKHCSICDRKDCSDRE